MSAGAPGEGAGTRDTATRCSAGGEETKPPLTGRSRPGVNTRPSLQKYENFLRDPRAFTSSGRRQRAAEPRRPCPPPHLPARRAAPPRPPAAPAPRARHFAGLREAGRPPGRLCGRRGATEAAAQGHREGEPGCGVPRGERRVRTLTAVLSADGGAEQQQERSPAERLHGSGRRRGAEIPGKNPQRRGQRRRRVVCAAEPV